MDKYCFMCEHNQHRTLMTEDCCVINDYVVCTKGVRRYANPFLKACDEIELKDKYKQKLEGDETI